MNAVTFRFCAALASILIVIVAFGILIGVLYAVYVLPPFYYGATYLTCLPLVAGVSIAAMIGGLIGYRLMGGKQLRDRIQIGVVIAIIVACFVLYLSVVIVLNVRGT
ncbi:MAG: hypothetical protein ABR898_02200 [Terracidiphilus sp.]|jgi:hypothetical protein